MDETVRKWKSSDLGPIPENWSIETLSNLGGVTTSGSRGWARFYSQYGDLFVRITNMRRSNIHLDLSSARYVDLPTNNPEADRTRLRTGDLLVSITADIGIIGYIDENIPSPAYINQHIARVRFPAAASVSTKFLAYYLSSWGPQRAFVGSTDTGAKAGINLTTVGNLKAVLPPVDEQDRVAAALSDSDNLIAALERTIAKKQAIRQGMLQALLTGRIRLPDFAEPWNEYRLGNHVTYLKTVPLSRAQLDNESPLRYLHYGDIHTNTGVTLDAAKAAMPRAPIALARSAGRLQPGDLVFADASEDSEGVGKSVEVLSVPPEGVIPGLHTIAARFDKSVLTDGFKAYIQFIPDFRNGLLRLAAGTKVLATAASYISSIVLPLPAVDEQRAIASVLFDTETEIDALTLRLEKAKELKEGMMQELLTGRTRLLSMESAA